MSNEISIEWKSCKKRCTEAIDMLNPQEGPLSAAEFPLFISAVAAGFPSPADDFMEGTLNFNEYLVRHPAATFCVRVSGNSMIGAGVFPNDILVVDRSIKPNHGHVVIAALDGDLTVKRLMRENGRFYLFADNESFKPIEIKDGDDLTIWGVARYVIHAL